jgi:hypothetical protein
MPLLQRTEKVTSFLLNPFKFRNDQNELPNLIHSACDRNHFLRFVFASQAHNMNTVFIFMRQDSFVPAERHYSEGNQGQYIFEV